MTDAMANTLALTQRAAFLTLESFGILINIVLSVLSCQKLVQVLGILRHHLELRKVWI